MADSNAALGKRPNAQITHVGIFVRNMDVMIEFYTRILGMILTDRGAYYRGGEICFLSRSASEHHQVVFASGRPDAAASTINQISFFVEDLDTLRQYHAILIEQGVGGLDAINHGNAWSLYFPDPESNRLELYTVSPWHVQQPFADRLDLTEAAEVIRSKTLAMIEADPSYGPREQWCAELRVKIAGRQI